MEHKEYNPFDELDTMFNPFDISISDKDKEAKGGVFDIRIYKHLQRIRQNATDAVIVEEKH